MITRLVSKRRHTSPTTDITQLATESDVEQKLLLPFLTNGSYLGMPSEWVRTKEYMSPTEIDKIAGKRRGYVPDYSIWLSGIPLVVVEAKSPEVAVEVGLREAQFYAAEINKRYAPNVNPIGFALACNGEKFALAEWDSHVNAIIVNCGDAAPGTDLLEALRNAIGREALVARFKAIEGNFQARSFHPVASFLGGQGRITEQLGVNEFAQALFPTLTKYFAANSDDTSDEVIDRAYVSSDELSSYEGVLETYLKDRTNKLGGSQLQPIETSRTSASRITTELQKFSQNPNYFSRVQLIIGSVGAGKSTFIRRYYRRLISKPAADRTKWSFINFNIMSPGFSGPEAQAWTARQFVESFCDVNNFDVGDLECLEKLFAVELSKFERGPNKLLRSADPAAYARNKTQLFVDLGADPMEVSRAISRHFSGEKGIGIVVVFDNVDKRSREQQLMIFEIAQWFKDLTRALVLVNLRDTTFEAHRDEPPLDAFANAINFYVRAPRFSPVIRKRLELVLEVLTDELSPLQEYTLPSGYKIKYPSSKLGEFLLAIYLSLFDSRSIQVGSSLEALVAKDVRRALGMFGEILVSAHIPANLITGVALGAGHNRLPEYRIIRALMRGRYKYYNGRSPYIRNILYADADLLRPSNFLIPDLLEFLIRHRKEKIDFNLEGYATVGTIQKKMSLLGYDEEDVFKTVARLLEWGLVEGESIVMSELTTEEAVRVHASGFIHMRFFLSRDEYLIGITPDMRFASRSVAENLARGWTGPNAEPSLATKKRMLEKLRDYFRFEYDRRCRRHAFYEEHGFGAKMVLTALDRAIEHMKTPAPKDVRTRRLI